MAKSRLRRMHPRWLKATTPKRLKRGHLAQSLNEDTARSQTPCSYEVQPHDVHWGTLMAESHIPRARLEAARCTPMAENHIPRARVKAAKISLIARAEFIHRRYTVFNLPPFSLIEMSTRTRHFFSRPTIPPVPVRSRLTSSTLMFHITAVHDCRYHLAPASFFFLNALQRS